MAEDMLQTREQMLLDLAKPWLAEEKAREEMAWDAAHGDALIEEWVGAFQTAQGETVG